MNFLDFLDFFDNFSVTDIIISVVVISVIIFLIILSNNLSKKNKELKKKLNNVNLENNVNSKVDNDLFVNDVSNNVLKNSNNDNLNTNNTLINNDDNTKNYIDNTTDTNSNLSNNNVSFDETKDTNNIMEEKHEEQENNGTLELFESIMNNNRFSSNYKTDSYLENMDKEDDVIKDDINEILKDMPNVGEAKPYTKNVLKSISAGGQTSPVNIGKSTVDAPKLRVAYNYNNSENNNLNDENINRNLNASNNDATRNNLSIDSYNYQQNNYDYVNARQDETKDAIKKDNYNEIEEISKKLEEELKPQTIELTDYEKKQEEEAIISYQELLEAKSKNNITEDDEDIDTEKFIDELKNFRTDLKGE